MNRALVFGIAIFFAVVGIALLGGENNVAMAGHGCHGCAGDGGCDGGCAAPAPAECCGCGGRKGLFHRLKHKHHKCCEPACCAPADCAPACIRLVPRPRSLRPAVHRLRPLLRLVPLRPRPLRLRLPRDRRRPPRPKSPIEHTTDRCSALWADVGRKFGDLSKSRISLVEVRLFSFSRQAVFCSSSPSSATICSRIRNFWILPVTVWGKLSTNRTYFGTL